MSRIADLSPAALRAMFSQETDDTFIILCTFYGANIVTPVRICSNFLERLEVTDDDILYGVKSRGNDYCFIPFNITLPTEESDATTRCSLTLFDATQQILPVVRTLNEAPLVKIELMLASAVKANVNAEPEIEFPEFYLTNIQYNKDSITFDLSLESTQIEPFPAYTFVPSNFPGLF